MSEDAGPDGERSRWRAPARAALPTPVLNDQRRLWEQVFRIRYLAIAVLAALALVAPLLEHSRVTLSLFMLGVALPVTLGFHHDLRQRGHPATPLAFVDQVMAAVVLSLEPDLLTITLLVTLTMTGTAVVVYGWRPAAQAGVLGLGLLCLVAAFEDVDDPWPALAGAAVTQGATVAVVGAVSEQERGLRRRHADVVEGLNVVVWNQTPEARPLEGARTFANPEVERLTGHALAELSLPGGWSTIVHPDDRERASRAQRDAVRAGTDLVQTYRVVHASGAAVHVEERLRVERDATGRPAALRGVLVDVSARVEAEAQVAQYVDLVEGIQTALVVLELTDTADDRSLVVRALNPEGARVLGRPADHVAGTRIGPLLGAAQGPALVEALADVVRLREGFVVEEFRLESHPSARVYHAHAFPLPGQALGLSLQDVTERSMAAEVLRRQALHDGLTGLPNRTMLTDRLRSALAQAEAAGTNVALLMMDLDQFKEVNDALGHDHGDRLLVETARRLQRVLPEADTVARLGGDEFAVLLTLGVSPEHAEEVARSIRRHLERPFQIGGISLQSNGSIGVALFPEHATDAEGLTQRADVAMYAAKRTGGGVALYRPDLDQSSVRRLAILGELRQAIHGGQLVLHHQPKLDLRTGELAGAEALVRWQHPELGLVPPIEFIELAEVSGLIQALTRWVLGEAVAQVARWRDAGVELGVAVNLSVRNLYDADLVRAVEALLLEHGVAPWYLTLEITESELMHDPLQAMEVLGKLKALGVRTSIDDFGTGYSSLAYLKHLPIDELKIDRSFVGTMTSDDSDLTIVRSTIDLSHNLGLDVVAEGVEDVATLERLAELGCDRVQGYLLSRPVPGDELATWVAAGDWRRMAPTAAPPPRRG